MFVSAETIRIVGRAKADRPLLFTYLALLSITLMGAVTSDKTGLTGQTFSSGEPDFGLFAKKNAGQCN